MPVEKVGLRPKVIGLPIPRGETGRDEHVLDGDLVVGLDSLNDCGEFARVVVGAIYLWPISLSGDGSNSGLGNDDGLLWTYAA